MREPIKFGTDGWRAVIAEDFTFANVERVAYAVGEYVKATYHKPGTRKVPILVGFDTRFMADRFALSAARVLQAMDLPVKLTNHDVPTPCIAWATQHEQTAGALQFTASHNPPEYCGVKYIPHFAGPATNAITDGILSHLQDLPSDFEAPQSAVPTFDPKPPYLAALKKRIDFDKIGSSKLKVGFDALYSTSRDYIDRLLKGSGLKVRVLHNWRDPLFGGGMPEPKAQYLTELVELVKLERLDIGLATDGDADRFAVIDEKGNYFSPNQLLCLLTRHLVQNRNYKGNIIRTVATTHFLNLMAAKYGLEIQETPVGFKYIGELMRSGDVLLGGEESGGVSMKGHIPEKDGILANLTLVEMLAYEKRPLSVIWNELQQEMGVKFFYRRADYNLKDNVQKKLMEILAHEPFKKLGGRAVQRSSSLDGLKLYLDEQNWLLVRASGTEPLLRLYCEGTSEPLVDEVMLDFSEQVQTILDKLVEPQARSNKSGKKSGPEPKVESKV